uniref:RING-type domain-containing protein n=1 Tax=Macrostomum lignano TaxID=282301 RepID=A0A1I8GIQ7_9PLAT
MAEICQAKKLRLGNSSSAASSSRGNGGGGGMYTQHRMLEELTRKCTCAKCRNLADTPMVTKCGHCLCEACAQQLRSADGDAAQCPECGQKVNADEVKRDYATGKLFNALQVLREHIRSQSSQPSLERARCADCLGRTIDSNDASGADGNGTDEQAAAAMATAAAMKRCESLHERLTRLADDGERVDEERRRLLTEAETELAQWRDRLSQQLNERHAEAARELEKVRAEAERLLAAAAERHSQARSGATELRRLLDAQSAIKSSPSAAAAAAAPLSEEALASLRMGESRAAELLARLVSPTSSEAAAADFELSRRSEPDALSSGFAALLAQAGVDLVIRPYPAANQPELRPVCQYDMTGRLVRKVGGSGTGPSQFRQPMSAYVHDDVLYVVDSDNKRVQMFHVETLEPKGSLTHDGFSTDLHSVLASDNRIVVTDRDHSKAFVFDRQSRALLREVALEGKPFTLTSDSTGNLFISLTNERKVQIFDAAMAHKLHSPPFIYGVAFDSVGRRLFVADTFCHMLLAFQF